MKKIDRSSTKYRLITEGAQMPKDGTEKF